MIFIELAGILFTAFGSLLTLYVVIRSNRMKESEYKPNQWGGVIENSEKLEEFRKERELNIKTAKFAMIFIVIGVFCQIIKFTSTYLNG